MLVMLLKSRFESDLLMTMRYLNKRMELTSKEKSNYFNLEKGYEGELKFDQLTEKLQEERYIINDLLLEVNHSYFQIDTLIISEGIIYLLDIKNYEGDFYLESDKLYSMTTGHEYKNPIDQIKRSTTLLRQLLRNIQVNYLVEPFIIFINPEFTLYQVPKDHPFILPTQINRFFRKLNNTSSKMYEQQKKLAQTLMSLHQNKNPFSLVPKYSYEQLQKGIHCEGCGCFSLSFKKYYFVCKHCGMHEELESAILRNVREFKLLFPDKKLTTFNIYDWCQVELNRKTICRILKKNYTAFGNTRSTYYE